MALGQPLKPWILYGFHGRYVCNMMGWHYIYKTNYVLWVFNGFLTVKYIFSNFFIFVAHGQENEKHACLKDPLMYKEKQLYISKMYWWVLHMKWPNANMCK